MNRLEAREQATLMDAQMKAGAFSGDHIVVVKGMDAMMFFILEPAFLRRIEDYVFVFCEHHEVQVFHNDEFFVEEYKPV